VGYKTQQKLEDKMAEKYRVLIGFNVARKDGSEIRCEPSGQQLAVTSKKETDAGGNEYLRQVETPLAKPFAIKDLLTAQQIQSLCEMHPPALAIDKEQPADEQPSQP
jgi:hypothetical protein